MATDRQSDCKRCEGRGWVRKGKERLIECPQCVGQVRVDDLTPEQRKS